MKRIFNKQMLVAAIAVILGLGVTDAFAQKKKPVIRKKRTTVVKKKVVVPVYSVPSGAVMRTRLNSKLSSKTSTEGSTFTATVTEPVYSNNGVVVIPVGSTVTGRVDSVQKARKGGKPGTIDVSFTSVRLPNGTTRAINGSLTDLDTKDGKSDNEGSASGDKMKHRKLIFIGGGGAGGALLGAAVGGGKGALIGGIIGGVGGLITETQTKGEDVDVKSGTEFGVYLNQSVSLPKFNEATVRP
ncbi:MAG TPA: TrbI/VirB10 family protein [Pyrinomonadaceae bacterium]|nr:TrbI/VirB10 family protein [Pyrinomonadaceae bacterium]